MAISFVDQARSNNAQILGWLAFDIRPDIKFSEQRQKTADFKIVCSEILLDGKNVDISIRKPILALAK